MEPWRLVEEANEQFNAALTEVCPAIRDARFALHDALKNRFTALTGREFYVLFEPKPEPQCVTTTTGR